MGKCYAVRKGLRTGIFDTWNECKQATQGVSGAEFKSFESRSDAEDYMRETIHEPLSESKQQVFDATLYVDGITQDKQSSSSGLLYSGESIALWFHRYHGELQLTSIENVVAALIEGVRYAKQLGWLSLLVYTNNEVIIRHVTGKYQVKTKHLRPIYNELFELIRTFSVFEIRHCEKNKVTHSLADTALMIKESSVHTIEELASSVYKLSCSKIPFVSKQ